MVIFVFVLCSLNFFVLVIISVLHLYWAFGGKAGFQKSLPADVNGKVVLQPGRIACLLVALALAVFAILFPGKLEIVRLPGWINHYGVFIISIIFLARAVGDFRYVGFTKRFRTTTFGKLDTKYYSPLCLLLGINGITIEFLIRTFPLV